ncbi:MAG TPA: MarR family winged helix-turn-helix transcriptional regulator [Streptosporangiaceae bacterium]|nr:MarR family winged helix-turn-helix transcriptional regulator [Streptosporangiaceae bacterium]
MSRGKPRPAPTDAPGDGDEAACHPDRCPCTDGNCTLSKTARAASPDVASRDHWTLSATEAAVSERLAGMSLDMPAMAAVSNVYRAAGAIRNHFEHTVLAPYSLTWTGWVVLWVVWIWQEIETRHVAAEAGISKGTLTGVAGTLEKRGLVTRRAHPDDARRVLLSLTPSGLKLMTELFPQFNKQEVLVVESLSADEIKVLAAALRKIVVDLESGPAPA